jgi:hypothetical protein
MHFSSLGSVFACLLSAPTGNGGQKEKPEEEDDDDDDDDDDDCDLKHPLAAV